MEYHKGIEHISIDHDFYARSLIAAVLRSNLRPASLTYYGDVHANGEDEGEISLAKRLLESLARSGALDRASAAWDSPLVLSRKAVDWSERMAESVKRSDRVWTRDAALHPPEPYIPFLKLPPTFILTRRALRETPDFDRPGSGPAPPQTLAEVVRSMLPISILDSELPITPSVDLDEVLNARLTMSAHTLGGIKAFMSTIPVASRKKAKSKDSIEARADERSRTIALATDHAWDVEGDRKRRDLMDSAGADSPPLFPLRPDSVYYGSKQTSNFETFDFEDIGDLLARAGAATGEAAADEEFDELDEDDPLSMQVFDQLQGMRTVPPDLDVPLPDSDDISDYDIEQLLPSSETDVDEEQRCFDYEIEAHIFSRRDSRLAGRSPGELERGPQQLDDVLSLFHSTTSSDSPCAQHSCRAALDDDEDELPREHDSTASISGAPALSDATFRPRLPPENEPDPVKRVLRLLPGSTAVLERGTDAWVEDGPGQEDSHMFRLPAMSKSASPPNVPSLLKDLLKESVDEQGKPLPPLSKLAGLQSLTLEMSWNCVLTLPTLESFLALDITSEARVAHATDFSASTFSSSSPPPPDASPLARLRETDPDRAPVLTRREMGLLAKLGKRPLQEQEDSSSSPPRKRASHSFLPVIEEEEGTGEVAEEDDDDAADLASVSSAMRVPFHQLDAANSGSSVEELVIDLELSDEEPVVLSSHRARVPSAAAAVARPSSSLSPDQNHSTTTSPSNELPSINPSPPLAASSLLTFLTSRTSAHDRPGVLDAPPPPFFAPRSPSPEMMMDDGTREEAPGVKWQQGAVKLPVNLPELEEAWLDGSGQVEGIVLAALAGPRLLQNRPVCRSIEAAEVELYFREDPLLSSSSTLSNSFGLDLQFSLSGGLLVTPLRKLPALLPELLKFITAIHARLENLLILLALPSSTLYADADPDAAWTPPTIAAVGKLRRAIAGKGLVDEEGRGMRCSVGWAAEDQVGQLVRGLVSHAIEEHKVVAGQWLEVEESEQEELELDALRLTSSFAVLNPLSAAYILARIPLPAFIELLPHSRTQAFAPALGPDRARLLNLAIASLLLQQQQLKSSPTYSSSSGRPPSSPTPSAAMRSPPRAVAEQQQQDGEQLLEEMGLVEHGRYDDLLWEGEQDGTPGQGTQQMGDEMEGVEEMWEQWPAEQSQLLQGSMSGFVPYRS